MTVAEPSAVSSAVSPVRTKPIGRHIQFLHSPADGFFGINDHMWMFSWFMDVAIYNNATFHMPGGSKAAAQYLGRVHSQNVSNDWLRYLSSPPECGIGPFNEVEPFEGCRDITDPLFDFSRPLFSGEDGCVNVMRMYKYTKKARHVPLADEARCHIRPSPAIHARAHEVLSEQGLPQRYGAYHIRRCDRLATSAECTEPHAVASVIRGVKDVSTWVIFYYAEPGYRESLQQAVDRALSMSSHHIIVFESSLHLSPLEDNDNIYSYLVARSILRNATVRVETRGCKRGAKGHGTVVHQSRMYRQEEDWASESDSELLGLCKGVPETNTALA